MLFLEMISKLEERNDEVLYNYIEAIKDEEIFKGSSTALNIFSLLNLALYRKDSQLFRSVINLMESNMITNLNFFKPVVNFIHYFCFYAADKFEKEETIKFYEGIVYFLWKFIAHNLKNYFEAIFDTNEEYDGDNEARALQPVYFQAIDLVISIINKTPSAKLRFFEEDTVEQMFAYLQNFTDTEKKVENKHKWSRLTRKLITGIDRAVLGEWIRKIPLNKENYNTKRLRRFYIIPFTLRED